MRSILRYIQNSDFEELYNQADDDKKAYIDGLVLIGDKLTIAKMIKEYRNGPLESKSLRELRLMARFRGIEHWYHLTRPSLLMLLKE